MVGIAFQIVFYMPCSLSKQVASGLIIQSSGLCMRFSLLRSSIIKLTIELSI